MAHMSEPRLQVLEVGAIRMRVAELGEGPLVLLCHGLPECWRSWSYVIDLMISNETFQGY